MNAQTIRNEVINMASEYGFPVLEAERRFDAIAAEHGQWIASGAQMLTQVAPERETLNAFAQVSMYRHCVYEFIDINNQYSRMGLVLTTMSEISNNLDIIR